ncbi:MAG: glycoside hydrolase N-terminal domain-containing protein [Halobacteriaceae archaeon]
MTGDAGAGGGAGDGDEAGAGDGDGPSGATDGGRATNRLWYRDTPDEWVEALPVGSGRLGAMVFGYPAEERVQLNEEHLWAGDGPTEPADTASEHLEEVRELLLDGEHEAAHEVADEHLLGEPRRLRPYQAFGDLHVALPGHDDPDDYTRALDLETGVATTSYAVDGTTYRRECFASAVDDVVVYRVVADADGSDDTAAFDARVSLSREQDARSAAVDASVGADEPELVLRGQVLDLPEFEHGEGDWGQRFEGRVRARVADGTVEADADAGELVVEGATELTLLVAMRTEHTHDDPTTAVCADLDAAADRTGDALRADHVADHARFFDRVSLDLGGDADADRRALPTDERLAAVADGAADPGLVALYVQYARYLLISSSRPGGLPANLQGIWCGDMEPAWNSGFTTNLNVEMNYWAAEVTNLADCAGPLLDLVDSLRPSGRKTASAHYDCDGWCVHHNTDLWRSTTPVDGVWGIWPVAGAWLCRHVWEHYAYSRDDTYLAERGYPIMREAAAFALDYLVEDDAGRLVTAPSVSPENIFVGPDGFEGWLCVAPTVDVALLRELFGNVVAASEVLDRDPAFRERCATALEALPDYRVGSDGRLQEWRAEYEEHSPGHRHLSHCYGAHPGDQITPRRTPELADAVEASIEHRLEHGSGSTGWSQAWLVNQYARLGDGEAAHRHVRTLLGEYTADSLLDLHPPFQIDGNFGGAAGVAECLLQSHEGEVALLPALPDAWSEGRFAGLRARGGFEVDLAWADGSPTEATVTSTAGERCRVRVPDADGDGPAVTDDAGESVPVDVPEPGVVAFETAAGERYHLAW